MLSCVSSHSLITEHLVSEILKTASKNWAINYCFNFNSTVLFCYNSSYKFLIFTAKKAEPDREDTPAGEAIIPTLPDVKMCAAKAIARSARNGNSIVYVKKEIKKTFDHMEITNIQDTYG